jgi:orotidine-5'-phosphate decarboxylase
MKFQTQAMTGPNKKTAMNRTELTQNVYNKKSMLCVGLDTDVEKLPDEYRSSDDGVFQFNKAIIDATAEFAVSYKINTAFYESQGIGGWESLKKTLAYLPKNCFAIADAKRGDIGNTATQYAKTFFYTYPFHAITVAPYMGADSVKPFLEYEDKWAIVLGLTSNPGSLDFQMLPSETGYLYEMVLKKTASWGHIGNLMFVIGATRNEQLAAIRAHYPQHFFLVPGIGAQGGDLQNVCKAAIHKKEAALLINVSRAIIYASTDKYFAEAAHEAAKKYQREMSSFL